MTIEWKISLIAKCLCQGAAQRSETSLALALIGNLKVIMESSVVNIRQTHMYIARLVVIPIESVSVLNHEEIVLLSRDIEAGSSWCVMARGFSAKQSLYTFSRIGNTP